MSEASTQAAPMRRSTKEAAAPRGEDEARRQARKAAKRAGSMAKSGRGRPGGHFVRRGGNYGRTIAWAVRDTFAAERRRFAVALTLGGLSLAAQALAVFVVYGYAQAIREDGAVVVPILGIDWPARTDSALLLAVVAGFAASLAAAVLLNFLSQGLLLGVVGRRLARAIEGLARAVNALPDPRAPRASRLASDFGFGRLSGGLAGSARSAFLVVQTIPALVGACLSGAVLFWMEPLLTLILVAVTAAWSALLYPVALRVVKLGRALRRASGETRTAYALVPPPPEAWTAADEHARAYSGWLRTRAEVVVVVGIGVAVIVGIAIYVMGAEMMDGSQGWPALIAYVGALQVALNGVFRTVRAVATVSRRYPEMVRNRMFVADLRGLRGTTSPVRKGETVTLGQDAGGGAITAVVGERLAVMTQESIQRIQLVALHARDADGHPVRSARSTRGVPGTAGDGAPIVFVDSRLLDPGDDPRAALDGAPDDRLVVVVHFMPATVGAFGETRLLLVEDDEITGVAPIGSDAAAEALRRATRRAAKTGRQRGDQSVEDDDDVE